MFENFRVFETEFAGRKMTFETGKMCCQAGGSVLVRYGETTVLVNATASAKPRDGIDFLPLSVDFEEKLYAVGKIPGSFLKREGRPSDKAVLSSRVVDRPIRPLFPKDMRNDVSVVMTVMSVDQDCSPEIAGMIGTSIALSISDIPWKGPIAGVFMGLVDGELVVNPTEKQREASDLQLTVAASAEKIVMIEAGANEVDEDTMLNAIKVTGKEMGKVKIVINGAGAAGIAIGKLLFRMGFGNVVMCDINGVICAGDPGLNPGQEEISHISNLAHEHGTLADALRGADAFVGVSRPNLVTAEMVSSPPLLALASALELM